MKKNEKIIHIEQAGTLKNFISETEKMNITHLKISGLLNSKDFDILDDMCTSDGEFDDNDNRTTYMDEPPFLTVLDLGECNLTDESYLGEFTYYSKQVFKRHDETYSAPELKVFYYEGGTRGSSGEMRNIKVYMQHLTIFGSFWRPSYAFILASVTELWADGGAVSNS